MASIKLLKFYFQIRLCNYFWWWDTKNWYTGFNRWINSVQLLLSVLVLCTKNKDFLKEKLVKQGQRFFSPPLKIPFIFFPYLFIKHINLNTFHKYWLFNEFFYVGLTWVFICFVSSEKKIYEKLRFLF